MSQTLANSLTLIDTLHHRASSGFAAPIASALGGDPYFVDLPAFHGGTGALINESALQVIAALYFNAEVEGTYLMAVGEELARARFTLNLTDRSAANRLEELARAMQGDWIERDLRNQIFARVFGVGYADPNLGEMAVNQEFEPQFARICLALRQTNSVSGGAYLSAAPGAQMRVVVATQTLLSNLAPKVQGNTLLVSERLSRQLKLVIAALDHPGMASLFQGRTAWDVVRSVLAADTPDLLVHVNRAQTGMRILSWMASNLSALRTDNSQSAIDAIRAEPQLSAWAEIWLDAAGIPIQQQSPQYGRSWAS